MSFQTTFGIGITVKTRSSIRVIMLKVVQSMVNSIKFVKGDPQGDINFIVLLTSLDGGQSLQNLIDLVLKFNIQTSDPEQTSIKIEIFDYKTGTPNSLTLNLNVMAGITTVAPGTNITSPVPPEESVGVMFTNFLTKLLPGSNKTITIAIFIFSLIGIIKILLYFKFIHISIFINIIIIILKISFIISLLSCIILLL